MRGVAPPMRRTLSGNIMLEGLHVNHLNSGMTVYLPAGQLHMVFSPTAAFLHSVWAVNSIVKEWENVQTMFAFVLEHIKKGLEPQGALYASKELNDLETVLGRLVRHNMWSLSWTECLFLCFFAMKELEPNQRDSQEPVPSLICLRTWRQTTQTGGSYIAVTIVLKGRRNIFCFLKVESGFKVQIFLKLFVNPLAPASSQQQSEIDLSQAPAFSKREGKDFDSIISFCQRVIFKGSSCFGQEWLASSSVTPLATAVAASAA